MHFMVKGDEVNPFDEKFLFVRHHKIKPSYKIIQFIQMLATMHIF